MIDISHFLALEAQVWGALVSGDAASDLAMLAPEFVGVYSTGFSDRSGHVDQLADGPTVAQYKISKARLLELGAGRTMLCYRADFTRTGMQNPEAMYISSIWEERGGAWLNTFSQDSNIADPAPV